MPSCGFLTEQLSVEGSMSKLHNYNRRYLEFPGVNIFSSDRAWVSVSIQSCSLASAAVRFNCYLWARFSTSQAEMVAWELMGRAWVLCLMLFCEEALLLWGRTAEQGAGHKERFAWGLPRRRGCSRSKGCAKHLSSLLDCYPKYCTFRHSCRLL